MTEPCKTDQVVILTCGDAAHFLAVVAEYRSRGYRVVPGSIGCGSVQRDSDYRLDFDANRPHFEQRQWCLLERNTPTNRPEEIT